MRAIKGLVLFGFLGLFASSCFNPPEYSNNPAITFNDIQFKVTPNPTDADTLILYVDFRDGDGNMGLNDNYRDDPYHERNYYFEDAINNKLVSVGTITQGINVQGLPNSVPMIIDAPVGKLATNRTRNKPGFGSLPPFSSGDLNCRNYTNEYLLIAPSAASAIDNSYYVVDTLRDNLSQEYYLLKDTVYFQRNLNHYNIIVRFYESSGGPFTEFSWEDVFCQTFNGRFPVLSGSEAPLEGTIRYTMASSGFVPLFSIKNLRLDVIVKDRAFNKDSIRTPEFTLESIRVN